MYRATLTRSRIGSFWVDTVCDGYTRIRYPTEVPASFFARRVCFPSFPGGHREVRRMSAEALSETFDRPSSRMCFPFLFLIFSIQTELFGKWHCPAPRSSRPIVKPAGGLVLYLVGLEYGGFVAPMPVTQNLERRCRGICRKTGVVVTSKCCCSGASSEETSA